jgi:CheY-like chemotaxis protein
VEVGSELAAQHAGLRPGTYLRLAISDTGHGMDAATLNRIFEPFFTTKAPGEGTGLGLAVVHGIMQSHDGVVTVASQPGQGTRFSLYFPACASEEPETDAAAGDVKRGNGERILYVVDATTSPAEALKAVRADRGKYRLVITDLTMPGITGMDLAKELLVLRPDLPIVLTTGFSASLTPERVRAIGIRDILVKPLSIQSLGQAVSLVLRASPPS